MNGSYWAIYLIETLDASQFSQLNNCLGSSLLSHSEKYELIKRTVNSSALAGLMHLPFTTTLYQAAPEVNRRAKARKLRAMQAQVESLPQKLFEGSQSRKQLYTVPRI
mmetsp:Transcript_22031/g.40188  ORF Transcript_22031/g.40188 Transcript_22031/m.40188 type:complete len:108 (-) Transcript_22031:850-1173(-)